MSDLANADTVKPVNKTTAYRATDTEEWSTDVTNSITSDKFWLLSLSEVFGTATDGNKLISGETQYFKNEGSRYAWFTKGNVNAMSGIGTKNTIIAENFLTREGKKPVGYSSYSWWLRTPCVNVNLDKDFGAAGVDGGPFAYSMSNYSSVVPCFAF